MEILNCFKVCFMFIGEVTRVMVSGTTTLLLLSGLIALAASSVCPQGKQFLNSELQTCMNCTVCDSTKGMVVFRPCEVHQDTLCAPLSKLDVDWSFIQTAANPHRHKHQKHLHRRKESRTGRKSSDDENSFEKTEHDNSQGATEGAVGVTNSEVPFSGVETLVWDWQAIALTLAVFSCIMFFLVIALYSLYQARQWRRLKENFEADVEELSVRLSLMAATCNEKGETLEPNFAPVHDSNYLNNKCVYLEQLLNIRKDTKICPESAGNVYIEESNAPSGGGGGGKT